MKKIMFSFFALATIIIVLISWKRVTGMGAIHASGDDCYFIVNKNTTGSPTAHRICLQGESINM